MFKIVWGIQMLQKNKHIIINGKSSIITYSQSHANAKVNLYSKKSIKVIEWLLKGKNTNFKYPEGITTLKMLNSWDERDIGIRRVANYISEIRKVVPTSIILTFRHIGKHQQYYGLIKSGNNINILEDLKNNILDRLSKEV